MKKKGVIGVDIGGSGFRIAGITPDGKVNGGRKKAPLISREKDFVIDSLIKELKDYISRYNREILGIGIGIPGFFMIKRGILHSSPNFPGWKMVPIKRLIQDEIDIPIFVENDANAATFGEFWAGAGKGVKNLIFLGLGTGVGGGIIIDGEILHGSSGIGGEVGHLIVDPEGPICGCGNHGCIESYASATGIVNNYKIKIEDSNYDLSDLTAKKVFLMAQKGDRRAKEVFQNMGRYLGIAITSLINLLNPDMVIIGGGVLTSWELFINITKKEIKKRAIRPSAKNVRIVPAHLREKAGLIGAGGIAWKEIGLLE
ncbi:MAG: ROK family protein [Nitrospirota bacterium]